MKHNNVLVCLISILFLALIVNYFVGRSTSLLEGLGCNSTLLDLDYLFQTNGSPYVKKSGHSNMGFSVTVGGIVIGAAWDINYLSDSTNNISDFTSSSAINNLNIQLGIIDHTAYSSTTGELSTLISSIIANKLNKPLFDVTHNTNTSSLNVSLSTDYCDNTELNKYPIQITFTGNDKTMNFTIPTSAATPPPAATPAAATPPAGFTLALQNLPNTVFYGPSITTNGTPAMDVILLSSTEWIYFMQDIQWIKMVSNLDNNIGKYQTALTPTVLALKETNYEEYASAVKNAWNNPICDANNICGYPDSYHVRVTTPAASTTPPAASTTPPAASTTPPAPSAATPSAATPPAPSAATPPAATPPTPPTEPGCYVYSASGCRKHKGFDTTQYLPNTPAVPFKANEWAIDSWGMKNAQSGESKGNCDKRGGNYDSWCKTTDFKTHFNPPAKTPTVAPMPVQSKAPTVAPMPVQSKAPTVAPMPVQSKAPTVATTHCPVVKYPNSNAIVVHYSDQNT